MLIFVGIDDWNRAVFREEGNGRYFGTLNVLFDYSATAAEVLARITEADLCYFGRSFNCEPYGDPLPEGLKLKREVG